MRETNGGRNFYPRSPCGERRLGLGKDKPKAVISIHALLAESDPCRYSLTAQPSRFLSTLSLRRATLPLALLICQPLDFYPRSPCGERQALGLLGWLRVLISIHALLAESDGGSGVGNWPRVIFLSTLSLRRATVYALKLANAMLFLSTLSLRRATTLIWDVIAVITISIHALLAESDSFRVFYWLKVTISIHALLAESDIRQTKI